jgi:hypothetical protein
LRPLNDACCLGRASSVSRIDPRIHCQPESGSSRRQREYTIFGRKTPKPLDQAHIVAAFAQGETLQADQKSRLIFYDEAIA